MDGLELFLNHADRGVELIVLSGEVSDPRAQSLGRDLMLAQLSAGRFCTTVDLDACSIEGLAEFRLLREGGRPGVPD